MGPLKLLPLSLDMIKPLRHHIQTFENTPAKPLFLKKSWQDTCQTAPLMFFRQRKALPEGNTTFKFYSKAESHRCCLIHFLYTLHWQSIKTTTSIMQVGDLILALKKTKTSIDAFSVEQRKIRFGWKCRVHLTLWLSRVISFQQPKKDRDKGGQYVTFWQKAQLTYANVTKKEEYIVSD